MNYRGRFWVQKEKSEIFLYSSIQRGRQAAGTTEAPAGLHAAVVRRRCFFPWCGRGERQVFRGVHRSPLCWAWQQRMHVPRPTGESGAFMVRRAHHERFGLGGAAAQRCRSRLVPAGRARFSGGKRKRPLRLQRPFEFGAQERTRTSTMLLAST